MSKIGGYPNELPKNMKRFLNWRTLALVVSIVGLCIAAHLTALDLQERVPLCGPTQSCETVLTSKYAHIGPVPTSALGIAFYTLSVFWLIFEMTGNKFAKLAGFCWSAIGLLMSAGLMYLAVFKIHAVCQWCLGSAVCTALLFASWGQIVSQTPRPFLLTWRAIFAFATIFSGFVAFVQPFTDAASSLQQPVPDSASSFKERKISEILPDARHTIGNGPPTIIFFGDLGCPACQYWFPKFRAMAAKKDAKFAYRHYLKHLSTRDMTALSEQIDPAKFWKYLDAVFASHGEEDAVVAKWSKTKLQLSKEDANARIDSDTKLAKDLGFEVTPTIVWVDEKGVKRVLGPTGAYNELSNLPVHKK